MLIYSGDIKEHKHGVGMLLNKQLSKSYVAHYTISSSILLVKLHCKAFNLNADSRKCADKHKYGRRYR